MGSGVRPRRKRPENLTEEQELRLADLVRFNLRTVRAYLLKEDFQAFGDSVSPAWAGKFLDRWRRRTLRSRLEPMKKIAASLRTHREPILEPILNWFRAHKEISAAAVEGRNGKLKLVTKRPTAFAVIAVWRWPSTMRLATYRSPRSPTDSAEELISSR